MTDRPRARRRSVAGLAVVSSLISSCGSGPVITALGRASSGTVTVMTDFSPPNNRRTTSFTTRSEVAELRAALVRYHIRIASSQQGKMDGDCSGGVSVTLSVKLAGRTERLTGHSYTCADQQQGTLVGNVSGFVSDLGVSPG